jgi:lipopolysaccharide export system permease protein
MLVDVLRQFAITAVILVIVIAFGAAIKPLSGDGLLTGWDTMKYLFLAIIPMLQFALPFAGAFAATISLHRMAQDNEFIAMSVSGQSYVRLLAPMVVFGGTLTLCVAVLAQSVIPSFIGKMAEQMTSDLPRLLTNSIKQHTPFVQGNLVIWAQEIILDSKSTTDDRMALDQVAVAKTDENGRAEMYFTAAAAIVDVQNVDNQTSLHVGMRNTTQWTRDEEGGSLRGAREGHLTHPIHLPSLTSQRLTALSRSELLYLKDHPMDYHYVHRAATSLTIALTKNEFLAALEGKLKRDGSVTLIATSGGREFVISSTALVGTSFATPIEVTTIQRTGETSSLSPNKATILLDYSENGEIESVTFEMRDVIVGAGRIGENQRAQLVVPSLQVKGVVFPTNDEDQSIANLLHQAEESTSPNVKSTAANLRRHVAALDNHVAGRIGQRWAVSILPLLAILLGSLLALRNSERMPLNVYAKVFIPTVVAMLLIFSGGQMIRDAKEITGFSVMWIGNFALACLVIFHWLRLRVT